MRAADRPPLLTLGNVIAGGGGGTGALLTTGADGGGGGGGGGGAGGAGGVGTVDGDALETSADPKLRFEPAIEFLKGGKPGGAGGVGGAVLDLDREESFPIDSYQLPPLLPPPMLPSVAA